MLMEILEDGYVIVVILYWDTLKIIQKLYENLLFI